MKSFSLVKFCCVFLLKKTLLFLRSPQQKQTLLSTRLLLLRYFFIQILSYSVNQKLSPCYFVCLHRLIKIFQTLTHIYKHINMSSAPPTSLELWAAAKIIGRECATINKDYLLCKREDENPKTCEKHADKVTDCAHGM